MYLCINQQPAVAMGTKPNVRERTEMLRTFPLVLYGVLKITDRNIKEQWT